MQTASSTIALSLWLIMRLCNLHDNYAVLYQISLPFFMPVSYTGTHGQLNRDALLFGHCIKDLNPDLPATSASVLSTYTIQLRHEKICLIGFIFAHLYCRLSGCQTVKFVRLTISG